MKYYTVTAIVLFGFLVNYSTQEKLSCNNKIKNSKGLIDLCGYINKHIRGFVLDIKSQILDTIPSKQYTGNLTSIYFKLTDGAVYEVLPNLKYNEALYKELRQNFNLNLIADSTIKCIRYLEKGEVIKQ